MKIEKNIQHFQQKIVSKATILEEFAIKKVKSPLHKQFFAGFLAGIFVGIGYTALLITLCNMAWSGESQYNPTLFSLAKYLASFIFGCSIVLCCHFGASLFTGNCVGFLACIHKEASWRRFAINLAIVMAANWIGTLCFAIIMFVSGSFAKTNPDNSNWFIASEATTRLINFAKTKINAPAWQTILNGILCNVIIVASIMSWVLIDNKAASTLIIFGLIGAFVLGGYQHVVANSYLTSLAWLYSSLHGAENLTGICGPIFYNCLIPSLIGNFFGGAFITWIFYFLNIPSDAKKDSKAEIKAKIKK